MKETRKETRSEIYFWVYNTTVYLTALALSDVQNPLRDNIDLRLCIRAEILGDCVPKEGCILLTQV